MAEKMLTIHMTNRDDKKRVAKFEVNDPRESREPVKNVYVDLTALKKLGNPQEITVIIKKKES